MTLFGDATSRRTANAKALKAFGAAAVSGEAECLTRVVREGTARALFTVGYERRDGEGLMSVLRDLDIDYLADIRDKPISRKPDFRATALKALCAHAGIEYGPWPMLGSTEKQRNRLHETGDVKSFHRVFRRYAADHLEEPIELLARVVKKRSVALLCYERAHEECHRMVIADLIADKHSAGIVAIL